MSDSVWSHRQQPTRLPRPWDSPGKNTWVGCRFLLQCIKVKSESEVAQSCLTLCNPMDWSLPGSSIHGIFQARVLEWGAIAFSEAVYKCHYIQLNDDAFEFNYVLTIFCLMDLSIHFWLKCIDHFIWFDFLSFPSSSIYTSLFIPSGCSRI